MISLLGLFMVYGCKYFKKASVKETDSIEADSAITSEAVDSTAYYSGTGDQAMASPQAEATHVPVAGNYYMIVGCFTVPQNAEKYADKIRSMGYEAQIIPGRDNFQMVAARAYDNYRVSIGEIDKFRNEVNPDAWVYRKR